MLLLTSTTRGRAEEDVGALRGLKVWRARKEGRGSGQSDSEGLDGWGVDRLLALAASNSVSNWYLPDFCLSTLG